MELSLCLALRMSLYSALAFVSVAHVRRHGDSGASLREARLRWALRTHVGNVRRHRSFAPEPRDDDRAQGGGCGHAGILRLPLLARLRNPRLRPTASPSIGATYLLTVAEPLSADGCQRARIANFPNRCGPIEADGHILIYTLDARPLSRQAPSHDVPDVHAALTVRTSSSCRPTRCSTRRYPGRSG